ncbi:PP2C family protein-serine/threonine phosphatase [Streptomyces sp. NPDC056437]|uniref:PP2C family protein-serine/threonine phosphatase n=1 Tax=Streptomyces sp. NPDC056437 TaxID=3345816 RepID=UPI0036952D82
MSTSAQDPSGAGRERDDLAAAVAELSARNADLRAELVRRHLLDLATGVLVTRLATSPSEAAEQLARMAAETGLSTEDFAADVVNGVAGTVAVTPPPATANPSSAAYADRGPRGDEARRMRRAMTDAEAHHTVEEAAAALLDGGLRHLGVQSLWLWRRTGSGCLQLAGHAGVGATEASQWRWIPPSLPASFRPALLEDSPVWLAAGPPRDDVLPGPAPQAARAVLPLRLRGTTVGVALAVWPDRADLDGPVRRAVTDLMDVAARVLTAPVWEPAPLPALDEMLDAMAHPALTLMRDPETGALAVEHLNQAAVEALGIAGQTAGQLLSRALPLLHAPLAGLAELAHSTSSLQRAASLPAVDHADAAAPLLDVRVLPAGAERTVVLWHTSTDRGTAATRAVARLQGVAPFEDNLLTGTSTWGEQAYGIFGAPRDAPPIPLTELYQRVHPEDDEDLTELLRNLTQRRRGAATVIRVVRDDGRQRHVRITAEPLLDQRTLIGISGIYQDVSAEFHTEVALSATFDQLTAVQAQAALRHRLALQLQQAIVPEMPALEVLPGLQATARYRPAVQEYRVGGDWYDVLPLPDGKVLVAVGDIAGHGIDSATGMVALRNALRGLAFTGHTPGRLMSWLNEVTIHTQGRPTATAVCALYDPADRTLRWASAGHLPLLLLREGHARLLAPPKNILLGATPDARYEEITTQLKPGDTLLLFTDGLIERRHDALDEGLQALLRTAEELAGREIDDQVDRLLGAATGDTDDDTSLIAVRVR